MLWLFTRSAQGTTRMKIIDEKGRWFGKLNFIDSLVILFILCLIPAFYFGYKLYNAPETPPPPPTIILEKSEYDKIMAKYNRVIAEKDRLFVQMVAEKDKITAELTKQRDKVYERRDKFLSEHKRAEKYFYD